MALAIESSRFGHVEIDPATVIEFPDGLIGLGGSRYALLAGEPDSPFVWLHCIDDPTLSLPVTDPHRFFSGYQVELTDDDADRLGLDDSTPVDVYVTVVARAELACPAGTCRPAGQFISQREKRVGRHGVLRAEGARVRSCGDAASTAN